MTARFAVIRSKASNPALTDREPPAFVMSVESDTDLSLLGFILDEDGERSTTLVFEHDRRPSIEFKPFLQTRVTKAPGLVKRARMIGPFFRSAKEAAQALTAMRVAWGNANIEGVADSAAAVLKARDSLKAEKTRLAAMLGSHEALLKQAEQSHARRLGLLADARNAAVRLTLAPEHRGAA